MRGHPKKSSEYFQGGGGMYRRFLNWLEDVCTVFSDVTLVNSEFTKEVFLGAFNHWQNERGGATDDDNNRHDTNTFLRSKIPKILYPPIDLASFVKPLQPSEKLKLFQKEMTIVSMNRFERKKNVGLAIAAFKEVIESGAV